MSFAQAGVFLLPVNCVGLTTVQLQQGRFTEH